MVTVLEPMLLWQADQIIKQAPELALVSSARGSLIDFLIPHYLQIPVVLIPILKNYLESSSFTIDQITNEGFKNQFSKALSESFLPNKDYLELAKDDTRVITNFILSDIEKGDFLKRFMESMEKFESTLQSQNTSGHSPKR